MWMSERQAPASEEAGGGGEFSNGISGTQYLLKAKGSKRKRSNTRCGALVFYQEEYTPQDSEPNVRHNIIEERFKAKVGNNLDFRQAKKRKKPELGNKWKSSLNPEVYFILGVAYCTLTSCNCLALTVWPLPKSRPVKSAHLRVHCTIAYVSV